MKGFVGLSKNNSLSENKKGNVSINKASRIRRSNDLPAQVRGLQRYLGNGEVERFVNSRSKVSWPEKSLLPKPSEEILSQKEHRMESVKKIYGDILKAGNIDLDANMKVAESMSHLEVGAGLVDKNIWNYKRNSSLISSLKSAGNYDNALLAEFGNVHAGMIYGAAGIRLDLALTAGGSFQAFSQNIRSGRFSAGAVANSMAGLGMWFAGLSAPTKQTINWADAGFTWGDNSDDIWPIIQGYCTTSATCE